MSAAVATRTAARAVAVRVVTWSVTVRRKWSVVSSVGAVKVAVPRFSPAPAVSTT